MIPFFLLMFFTLVYQAFLNAMVVVFHASSSWMLVAPIVLVIAVFCLEIFEILWVLLFAGIVIDALTGDSNGANMVWMTLLGVLALGLSSSLGKPHWPMICGFLLGFSLLYRIIMSGFWSLSLVNLTVGPALDALIGLTIFYCLPKWVIRMD
jgi:hypothetical protein